MTSTTGGRLDVAERTRPECRARPALGTVQETLVTRIDALERAAAMPNVDRRALRADLKRRTDKWREPLRANVPQARQLPRKVLANRLTLTPEGSADRYSTITGEGTLTKIRQELSLQRAWRPQREPSDVATLRFQGFSDLKAA